MHGNARFRPDPTSLVATRPGPPPQLISEVLIGRVELAPARAGGSRASERYYVGRRSHDTEVYVVAGTNVGRLARPGYRSDSAFDWGGVTAGSLELAFALLAHATERRPPDPICLIFQAGVVARLDRAGFVLGDGDIALWLLTTWGDHDGSDDESCSERSPGLRRRAIAWLRSRWRL